MKIVVIGGSGLMTTKARLTARMRQKSKRYPRN
jgi:hypothetical protein